MNNNLLRQLAESPCKMLVKALLLILLSYVSSQAHALTPPTEMIGRKHSSITRTITGIVLDEGGEGLAGATITVKGTTRGTTTNASGKFTLTIEDADNTLVVSYIGFISKEVSIGNQSTFEVTLGASDNVMEEGLQLKESKKFPIGRVEFLFSEISTCIQFSGLNDPNFLVLMKFLTVKRFTPIIRAMAETATFLSSSFRISSSLPVNFVSLF